MTWKFYDTRQLVFGAPIVGKAHTNIFEVTSAGPDGSSQPMVICDPYGATLLGIPLEPLEWQQLDTRVTRLFQVILPMHFVCKEQRLCKNKVNWRKDKRRLCHTHQDNDTLSIQYNKLSYVSFAFEQVLGGLCWCNITWMDGYVCHLFVWLCDSRQQHGQYCVHVSKSFATSVSVQQVETTVTIQNR